MRFSLRATAAVLLLAGAGCAGTHGASVDGNAALYSAWRDRTSRVEVTGHGSVARVLGIRLGRRDRHEGFLVHLAGAAGRGLTVRVEDNVELTGPIPLAAGDEIEFRGEYEFDPRGGVVHWTHRDPRGRHPDGFIRVRGKTYA